MRQTIRCLVISAIAACSTAAFSQSFLGSYNGKNWYYLDGQFTQNYGRQVATGMGGTLASIHSQVETDWLLANGVTQLAWIGLSDEAVEGTFVWDDGSSLIYTNWAPGEPDDDAALGGLGDGVAMNFGTGGTWADTNPNFVGFVQGAVITTAVPEPLTVLTFGGALLALAVRRRARK